MLFAVAFSATIFDLLPSPWPPALRGGLAAAGISLLLVGAVRAWPRIGALPLGLPGWWRRYGCAALFGISLGSRLLVNAVSPAPPASDYLYYLNTAKGLLSGEIPPWEPYIVVIAPGVWAYATVLAGWTRLFGETIFAAQAFVALCFSGMTALFHQVARKAASPVAAAAAGLWVALSPETLLYTRNIGNEAAAMLLLMLGLRCLTEPSGPQGAGQKGLRALTAGLALAACQALRPIAALAWLPASLWLCGENDKQKRAGRVLWFLAALAVFFACDGALAALRAEALGANSAQPLGWTLFEGLDLAGRGRWTAEKSAVMNRLLHTLPAEQVQPALLRLARERVSAYGLSDWLALFALKLSSLWGDCGYVYADGAQRHVPAVALVTACLWAQGLLMSASLLRKRGDRYGSATLVCLSPVWLLTAFCLLGTSIPRYRFVTLPFLALALAMRREEMEGNGKGLSQNRR